ncbi:MAG: ABC transporter permease [Lactobacillales bacterium]|nr:ABC transporter permease [Lactobacillales bacterium]
MLKGTLDTLYMEITSMIFIVILGFFLGLFLFILSKQQNWIEKIIYTFLSIVSNILRSIPFIVLIILFIPAMSAIFGSFIGARPAILPLAISASPLYARMVEVAFREVDEGVLEAADAMGASKTQKILKVLIPESLPALLSGMSITAVSVIGYTAMAAVVGGGGLGGLAIQDGFDRNNQTVTLVATVIILIIVFILQFIGDLAVKKADKRKI